MRKYIYIDTNIITSYLAQENPNGIEETTTKIGESTMISSNSIETKNKSTKDEISIF